MAAVVIDAGSKLLKAGFASPDQDPSLILQTKMKRVVEDDDGADASMIEEVTGDPVVREFIMDWNAMDDLLRHVLYTNLGCADGGGLILFTDPLFTPKAVGEQLVQVMFETFNVSGFYAIGRMPECTVDIGHGKIDTAPVCEGDVQHITSKRFETGGVDLANLLAQELHKSNPLVNIQNSEVEKLEQHACCAEDPAAFEKTKFMSQRRSHLT